MARSYGLTPRQYLLLLVLESSGARKPPKIGELSESLGLAPSTMTELVDRAERAGLLERVHAKHDRRVFHVCATKEGRKRFVKAFRQLEDERRALAGEALKLVPDPEKPFSPKHGRSVNPSNRSFNTAAARQKIRGTK